MLLHSDFESNLTVSPFQVLLKISGMSTSQAFFVTGGTGQQGGHVARALLSLGHKVHAIVRDPSSPAALALQQLGALIFRGDFSDPASLHAAAVGTGGVFLNVYPVFTDPDGELKHAQNVISASRAAGVKKIVYSSAPHVSDYPDLQREAKIEAKTFLGQYFYSKYRIQETVKEAGFESWTILQPAWLLSNLIAPSVQYYFPEGKSEGVLKTAFKLNTKLKVLDPKDAGSFAAKALTSDNGRWNAEIVPLAAEELTVTEIADGINNVIGGNGKRCVKAEFMDEEEREKIKAVNPIIFAQIWLSDNGLAVDLAKVRAYGIPLTTLEQFAKREQAALEEALSASKSSGI